MKKSSSEISRISKVTGLLSIMLIAAAGSVRAETPLTGGGNPPMPPQADSAAVRSNPGTTTYVPWGLLGTGTQAISVFETPLTGGGNPPMPPYDTADETPLTGGGNPPMPPYSTIDETPLTGGGNPPMPPGGASAYETPLTGGGSPPMPPSCAVVTVVAGVALYADGTIGFPNGDFQFTSGAYLWADGFVRFDPAPADFVWTDYAGHIINTTRGDVNAYGLPHTPYLTVLPVGL